MPSVGVSSDVRVGGVVVEDVGDARDSVGDGVRICCVACMVGDGKAVGVWGIELPLHAVRNSTVPTRQFLVYVHAFRFIFCLSCILLTAVP